LSPLIPSPLVLSAAGTALVLDGSGPGLPRVRHFGADLGPVSGSELLPALASLTPAPPLLPAQGDSWYGRPGLSGARPGEHWPVRWTLDGLDVDATPGAGGTVTVTASDDRAGLALVSELAMDAGGLVTMRHTVTNTAASPYRLEGLTCALPLPARAGELLDFTGRWALEKVPQRRAFEHGVWSRENRRGRTGHDGTGLLVAGTTGFGFRAGEVWAVHAGWSGDHVHYAERLQEGAALLAAGELLAPGEVTLGEGESYRTPWVYFTWSGGGLDEASGRLHDHLRATRPLPVRPVTLNNWEATYFDHGLDRLLELAGRAAEAGIERFVLDDGWFRHRRHDRAGLGDWYVDEGVWPGGLHPLADRVRKLGMQFGLWFEPEMVNPDSDLAREQPDWILGRSERMPPPQRNQQVLDLARSRRTRTCSNGWTRWSASTPSTTSSGTTTATSPSRCTTASPACTRRRWPPTGCWTSCAAAIPGWRSSPARRAARASTTASWPVPTGSGPPTATTRSTGSRSSAGPACSCRPSGSAATSARRATTAPAGRCRWPSGPPPRCSGTWASSGT
jgi:alpha-galactosidase